MTQEEEELDELECRVFNPDNHITVVLPNGAWARVAPDISPDALAALGRLAQAMGAGEISATWSSSREGAANLGTEQIMETILATGGPYSLVRIDDEDQDSGWRDVVWEVWPGPDGRGRHDFYEYPAEAQAAFEQLVAAWEHGQTHEGQTRAVPDLPAIHEMPEIKEGVFTEFWERRGEGIKR